MLRGGKAVLELVDRDSQTSNNRVEKRAIMRVQMR